MPKSALKAEVVKHTIQSKVKFKHDLQLIDTSSSNSSECWFAHDIHECIMMRIQPVVDIWYSITPPPLSLFNYNHAQRIKVTGTDSNDDLERWREREKELHPENTEKLA